MYLSPISENRNATVYTSSHIYKARQTDCQFINRNDVTLFLWRIYICKRQLAAQRSTSFVICVDGGYFNPFPVHSEVRAVSKQQLCSHVITEVAMHSSYLWNTREHFPVQSGDVNWGRKVFNICKSCKSRNWLFLLPNFWVLRYYRKIGVGGENGVLFNNQSSSMKIVYFNGIKSDTPIGT